LEYLIDFYAITGRGGNGAAEPAPTKEAVLAEEAEDPNTILDAQRLVSTTAGLLNGMSGGPRKFLDVGCGYGLFAREASDRGFEVTALDLAANKRTVAREIMGFEPVACSFEDFNCAPSSFSAVLMSQVLEHVSDVNLWIDKLHTILVKNGIVAIALPNYRNIFRFMLREKSPYITPPEHLNFFSSRSLTGLLEKHGFKVEEVQWISRIPRRILRKRLPRPLIPLFPVVSLVSRFSLSTFDAMHLGLMINVYGRKVR